MIRPVGRRYNGLVELSVVVPAHNEERFLPACLEALHASLAACGAGSEIIVADDASTDRTAGIARDAGARVVRSGARNIAATRNAGAAAAAGRWLAFVDADTQVNGPLLSAAVSALRTGSVSGGGARLSYDAGGIPAFVMAECWNLVTRVADWAAGSFLFCRAEGFRAIRGFDSRIFASEEIDFSQRLGRWGRARGMRFVTLRDHAYVTSIRKAEEFTPVEGARQLVRALDRRNLRRREACGLWYDVKR